MGMNYKEAGGGPAVGLAGDFTSFLRQILQGQSGVGSQGARFNEADPLGNTQGVAGVLNSLLSGTAGGPMSEMISKQADRDAMTLRARYGMTGTGYGTPAAYAESMLRSETAPKLASVMQQGQMSALQQLLPILAQISGRGMTQREGYASPSGLTSALSIAAPVAGGILGSIKNPFGGGAQTATGVAPSTMVAPSVGNSRGWNDFWNADMVPNFSVPTLNFGPR